MFQPKFYQSSVKELHCPSSCLGDRMDIGAWQAIVHGVTKSQT